MRSEKSSKPTTELEVLQAIDRKMDQVIKLVAMSSVKDKPEIDQIRILKASGLTFKEIGTFMGTGEDAPRKRLEVEEKKVKTRKNDKEK